MHALAAFFFLGPSLSFRATLIGPAPDDGDRSVSVAESLSWRRRLADVGGVDGTEVRECFVCSEEGPGMAMDRGDWTDGMAEREIGLMVRRVEGVDMKWRKKGEEGRAGKVTGTYIEGGRKGESRRSEPSRGELVK